MKTINFVDELIDVLIEKYQLPEHISIVASGGSMGGLCAVVYTRYARRTPIGCVVNCPVCDLPHHFTEREDLPRTLYSAFGNYENMTLEEAMKTSSPVHLANAMPYISYSIFHCENDKTVNIKAHSYKLIQAMADYNITFYEVKGRDHCDLTEEMQQKYTESILKHFEI